MFKRKGQQEEIDIETVNVGSINFLDVQVEQSAVLQRLKGIENKMASIEQELVEANKSQHRINPRDTR